MRFVVQDASYDVKFMMSKVWFWTMMSNTVQCTQNIYEHLPTQQIYFKKDVTQVSIKSPPEIAQAMCTVGVKKSQLPLGKMLFLALLAGVYIGFGSQLMITVKVGLVEVVSSGFAYLIGGVFFVGIIYWYAYLKGTSK